MSTLVLGGLPCNALLGFPTVALDLAASVLDPGAFASVLLESGADTLVWVPPTEILAATRGSYALACAAADVGIKRVVLVSTLEFFSRHPKNWRLQPNWRPRPAPRAGELVPYLAELSLRESARALGLRVTVVRLAAQTPLELAAQAVRDALSDTERWKIRHVGEILGRPESDDGRSWRDVLAPARRIASQPIKKVAILGAGGPIGRAVADVLADDYVLRLADLRPLAAAVAQSPDAPIARPLPAPHEEVRLDVRENRSAVYRACEGCDAIINLTVVRHDFADAFAVNTLGAWNIGQAAVDLGIRRLVHTGPQLITLHNENDYSWDFQIAGDAPTRPGRHLYGHSKFLGNEALRAFAEWYDLEVPNLMFNGFAQPGITQTPNGPPAMMLSWYDAARAIRCALEVESLPSPYEEFHCVADFPHEQCRTDKAERLLGWRPQDPLDDLWRTRLAE